MGRGGGRSPSLVDKRSLPRCLPHPTRGATYRWQYVYMRRRFARKLSRNSPVDFRGVRDNLDKLVTNS